jgi:DNA-binding transcriptional regulator YiaG
MRCRCGDSTRRQVKHSFRRTVAGTTFSASSSVEACARCGETTVPAALVVAFERAIAADLARHGPISGETFRWIRKASGLERMELAQILGVTPETIAGWEEERRAIDMASWTVVATLALDAIEGPRPLRARLKARRRGATRSSVTVLTIDTPTTGTLATVLQLIAGPIAFTDADIADALDIDHRALRARLHELSVLGLLSSVGSVAGGPQRWDPITRDRAALLHAAVEAGVDIDAPLPRAHFADDEVSAPRARLAPMAWRTAT